MLIRTDQIRFDRQGRASFPRELINLLRLGDRSASTTGTGADFIIHYGTRKADLRDSSITGYSTSDMDMIEDKISKLPNSVTKKFLYIDFVANSMPCSIDRGGAFVLHPSLRQGVRDAISVACNNRFSFVSRSSWLDIQNCSDPARVTELVQSMGLGRPFKAKSAVTDSAVTDLAQIGEEHLRDSRKDWRKLEYKVAEAFSNRVDGIIELTQPSKDCGIDICVRIANGVDVRNLYVQVKSGGKRATVSDLRELIGVTARDGAKMGLLITSSGATADALREARGSKVAVDVRHIEELSTWIEADFWKSIMG